MKLLVDIDGCLNECGYEYVNAGKAFLRRKGVSFDRLRTDKYEFSEIFNLTDMGLIQEFEESPELQRVYVAGVKPFASAVLHSLKDKGVEIIIVTARKPDEFVVIDEQMQKSLGVDCGVNTLHFITLLWLQLNDIPFDSVEFAEDKGVFAASLDGEVIAIDDYDRNIEDYNYHDIPCIVFDQDYNQRCKNPRVWNWLEIEGCINKIRVHK